MKILLVQTGFLGDVILSTPAIGAIAELYPDCELSVLTTPAAVDLIRFDPFVKEVLVYDKRHLRAGIRGLSVMARELRKHRFDIVFSLHKSFRTAILLLLARIPERYGFSEASAWWTYTKTAPRKDLPHEVLRNLAIFRTVGKEPAELLHEMRLFVSPEAAEQAAALVAPTMPWIGIAPGSVWPTKRWTPQGFAHVADALHERGFRVVLIGGPDDVASADEVLQHARNPHLNLVGKTSVAVSVAIIKQLAALIANDSSPLHMAAALRCPVVVLFCATVPEFGFGPWLVPSRVLGVEGLACRPCRRHGDTYCPTGTHACQLQLAPERVLASMIELLQETSTAAFDNELPR